MGDVPISTIVNVQISRQTRGVTQAGFGVPLILSDEATTFGGDLVREYLSADEVLDDFSSGSDTYKAAAAIFNQNPRVELVKIGAEGTRVQHIQTLTFNADIVTGNTITMTVDGTVIAQAFNTDHLTTMNALATQISAITKVATATVGGAGNRVITIPAQFNGVPVSVSVAVVTGGASQATSVVAETQANVGVADFLADISEADDDWYGLIWIERVKQQVYEAAAYIATKEKIFITCSNDADIIDSGQTDDIASLLSLANNSRAAVIYNADPADFADAAWMGNCFTFDPGEETWMFKTLEGITADTALTSSERRAASDKNCNLYVTIGGNDMTEFGTMASGLFIDEIRGIDWLTARLRERVFALLKKMPKVPFTDAGIASVEAEVRAVLENAENFGLLASDPKFTVTVPKATDVSPNDRAERVLPDVEFDARLAGAIHKVNIDGVVTV